MLAVDHYVRALQFVADVFTLVALLLALSLEIEKWTLRYNENFTSIAMIMPEI
jgi:hypothetical protein